MPIIDMFVIVLVCAVLLGLAWLSERIKDWLWSYVFKFLGFLFQTALGVGVLVILVGVVMIYVLTDWIPHLTSSEVQSPYWFSLVLWGSAAMVAVFLVISGFRRIFREEEGSEQLAPEPARELAREPEYDMEYGPFPWKRLIQFEAVYMLLSSTIWGVLYYQFGPTVEFTADWQYVAIGSILFLTNLALGCLVWLPFEAWQNRRAERFQAEERQQAEDARVEERRLSRLAESAAEAEREAEAARWADPVTNPGVPLAAESSDPFGSRLFPPPVNSPRDPASGGPTHPPAPSTRRMPPRNFGRPTARPAEERDMERHEPTPPRRTVGRRGRPWYVWAVVVALVAGLIGGGVYAWSKRDPPEDTLVERAAKMQAEDTLHTYMKADPVMSKNCPQGFSDDCWRTLDAATPKIELPPCVSTGVNHGSTTGASWWMAMDDQCRAETIRQNGVRVEEAAAQPSGEVAKFLFDNLPL